ncbi:MAG: PEP-CTERM sorting domain-containing protein [Fuerstiella sp.]
MNTKVARSHFAAIVFAMAVLVVGSPTSTQAGVITIGDFRIGATDVVSDTPFDPGVTFATRGVSGAPVQIVSDFSVASQNADGTLSAGEDVILRTFSSVTRIRNLSRFAPSDVAGSGVERVGIAQWSFNLSPLDSYLATNNLTLAELDLDLLSVNSDTSRELDVYLSYTLPADGITLTSIDSTTSEAGANNFTTFYEPARGAAVGDVVNGTHRVLQLDTAGNLDINSSLLTLFNSGVRDFNLSVAGGDFLSARNIDIAAGSGISLTTLTTAAVPEPSSLVLLLAGSFLTFRRRKRTSCLAQLEGS